MAKAIEVAFETLKGRTLSKIDGGVGYSRVLFHDSRGMVFMLFHEQGCCEDVRVEDIAGDLDDLIGAPILLAEEVVGGADPEGFEADSVWETWTWTFYKLSTIKGSVTIRWLGASNGMYSEKVDFADVTAFYTSTKGQG